MAKRLKSKPGTAPRTIRHGAPTRNRSLTVGTPRGYDSLVRHITKHIGKPEYVLHEILSELVHIDVHVVVPTRKRPFWYLVTTGMSDRPMHAPKGAEAFRFAELAIALPGWWKLDERSLKLERWYWPVRWLKVLARFPHDFETWVFYQHSVPLADEFPAPGTKFEGVVFGMDDSFPQDFWKTKVGKRTVYFLSPLPVHPEEMKLNLEAGPDALRERLASLGDYDSYDPKRTNSCTANIRSRVDRAKAGQRSRSRPGS